jgi:hypothetical protein
MSTIEQRIAEAKQVGAKAISITFDELEALAPKRGPEIPLAQRELRRTEWERELRHSWAYDLAYQLGYPKETAAHAAVAKVLSKEVAEILVHYGTRKP